MISMKTCFRCPLTIIDLDTADFTFGIFQLWSASSDFVTKSTFIIFDNISTAVLILFLLQEEAIEREVRQR